jgi:hypothetical protein
MSLQGTCPVAQLERQQQNVGIIAGIGTALVAAVTAIAVLEALKPDNNYYHTDPPVYIVR